MSISRTDIELARKRISSFLQVSPLVHSTYYSRKIGAEIYLKLESLQPTHSFKVRGAMNAALALTAAERTRGIVTATGGNHGLALAYIAHVLDIPALIFVPESTSPDRQALIREFGAVVIVHGRDWDDANDMAVEKAAVENLAFVHPFDDLRMIAGAATVVIELIEQLGQLDLIVASIGGGGLVSGLLEAVRHFSPGTRVVGVETVGTDSMFQSLQAAMPIELPAITSIVTSLAARRPGVLTYEIVSERISDLVTVTDYEAVTAALELLDQEKILVEPAAACCLAALQSGKISYGSGEKIGVIMCGANITVMDLLNWQAQLAPASS